MWCSSEAEASQWSAFLRPPSPQSLRHSHWRQLDCSCFVGFWCTLFVDCNVSISQEFDIAQEETALVVGEGLIAPWRGGCELGGYISVQMITCKLVMHVQRQFIHFRSFCSFYTIGLLVKNNIQLWLLVLETFLRPTGTGLLLKSSWLLMFRKGRCR